MSVKTHGGYVGTFKKKIDNSDMEGKKAIRDWCMEEVAGSAANCTVLELYGGAGKVHDACYVNPPVKKHMAFEIKKGLGEDRPTWITGDNKVLLPKYVNDGWGLFDLDAYCDPWMLAMNIAKLRSPGRFAMAMTCSVQRPLNGGAMVGYLRKVSGYNAMPLNGLLGRYYNDIIQCCVNDWRRFGVTVESARKTRSVFTARVSYYGFVVNKTKA